MSTEVAAPVVLKETLEEQLEQAKECLKDVDENIKKLTGRDPNELRPGMRRGPLGGGPEGRGRDRVTMIGKRDAGGLMDGPPGKRRALGGVPFNRLGPRMESRRNRGEDSGEDDDLPHKPTVPSSIVATLKEIKSRKDCLEEQKQDSKGLARNRRMFGLILGTLQKFKDEETVKKEKEMKRLEIEKKLEAAAEKEKEDLKKERQELFVERRRRQANLRRLEQKMEIVKQHGEWETHHKNLLCFIQTKTKPSIFYLPAKHTLVTEERLKESRKRIEALIEERRAQTSEELQSLDVSRASVSEAPEQIETEAAMKDDEDNVVEEAEMKEDEEEDESATKENVPESGNDGCNEEATVDGLEKEEEGKEMKSDQCDDNDNAENVEDVVSAEKAELDQEEENNPVETEKELEESKSNEAELFAKDQNLLTEKEFEPIYD